MPDIDRYITDDGACRLAWEALDRGENIRDMLRAALPGILAAYRADVLREAAVRMTGFCLDPQGRHLVSTLRAWADEQVQP